MDFDDMDFSKLDMGEDDFDMDESKDEEGAHNKEPVHDYVFNMVVHILQKGSKQKRRKAKEKKSRLQHWLRRLKLKCLRQEV
ncbi:hypothetical protein CK203_029516 [Vitis vinifera]|uniref:Uncharacterized protein n=1 Tax=Vitis vinifera TaxID=29760 RepID=A0A438JCN4_VITVI|nr:hypothetical protein CK203_029516 [Vitis vinifera]